MHQSEWTLKVVLETPGIHSFGKRLWRSEIGGFLGGAGIARAARALVGLEATVVYQEAQKHFSILANSTGYRYTLPGQMQDYATSDLTLKARLLITLTS